MLEYEAYVITIAGHEQSEKAANRCIRTARDYGEIVVNKFYGVTPKDTPKDMMLARGINHNEFEEKYSRKLNAMAAFMSHYSVWEQCITSGKPTVIFEHDAVVTGRVPVDKFTGRVATISRPSYGDFQTPEMIGFGPLRQKAYFGGAHGYIIRPEGAWALVETAQGRAAPTDIYIHYRNFPWLQEYYPWVCEARDTFSTIQNNTGCLAKHNYDDKYEIADV